MHQDIIMPSSRILWYQFHLDSSMAASAACVHTMAGCANRQLGVQISTCTMSVLIYLLKSKDPCLI